MICSTSPTTHVVASAIRVEQTSLEEVDVLELIDHEGAVLLAHDGGDVGTFLQHAAWADEDVLEINDTAFVLRVLLHVEARPYRPPPTRRASRRRRATREA